MNGVNPLTERLQFVLYGTVWLDNSHVSGVRVEGADVRAMLRLVAVVSLNLP
jgi:hypothetical protein